MDLYQAAIRPLLFSGLKADPEWMHHQVFRGLAWLQTHQNQPLASWFCTQLENTYGLRDPRLHQSLWGLDFANPIGLGAGFDKDGLAATLWSSFGFGFAELGTVTHHPQPGNPKPRLFRLLPDQAVLNRMGFNNQGAVALAERLAGFSQSGQRLPQQPLPLGINLGKSKVTPLEQAAQDYQASFQILQPWGDYFVVNVSSPNTPGLRSLQSSEQLEPIFAALTQANQAQKPLLVKIAPDLDWEQIAAVLDLARQYQLAGIIATNTTIQREGLQTQILPTTGNPIREEAGGISGAPLRQRSTEVIRFIYHQTQGQLPIIGVGGIFTAEDAWEKITAGASLLQVYTGWIYEGPWMVKRILAGLGQKLSERGLDHISQAIGQG